jgi:hypothetical protein
MSLYTISTSPRLPFRPSSRPAGGHRVSSFLPWAVLLLLLIMGLPLFICRQTWIDAIHYDLCARKLLHGGAMYRDIFDNNLPGMIWAQTAVRALLGWRMEMLRVVDLGVISLAVVSLLHWVPTRNGSQSTRVWVVTALCAFYLFAPSVNHCQRDGWMLLPAVAGLRLRDRRLRLMAAPAPGAAIFRQAVLEGLCWGAALWIKPFVVVPALACWVVGVLARRRNRRGVWLDAAGLLTGGVIAGGLGLAWLGASGSWGSFWEILLEWNREYASHVYARSSRSEQIYQWVEDYLPWCLINVLATAAAVTAVGRALQARGQASPWTASRALLGTFYLGWLAQAMFIQYPHAYALAATIFPAVAFVGSASRRQYHPSLRRMAFSVFPVLVLLLTPGLYPESLSLWPRCWNGGCTPELRDDMTLWTDYPVHWRDLARVAAFLRSEKVRDRELVCMGGWTHWLYLELGLEPSTRYPQIIQLLDVFRSRAERVRFELDASPVRFVVSDLECLGMTMREALDAATVKGLGLPPCFPRRRFGTDFPWYEPLVFRSGRYVVHRVTRPVTNLWLYEWDWAKDVPRSHVSAGAPGPNQAKCPTDAGHPLLRARLKT